MIARAFLFSFKAGCRFLISTCYFADFDSLSPENMIADLLSSPISIQKLSIRSAISIYHWAQLVHFSTQKIILNSKTSPDRFGTAIFSVQSEHVFTLKSLPERLKRDFDDCKSVSFQFISRLQVSHFKMLFCRFQQFQRRKHDSGLTKFSNFNLEAFYQVRDFNISLGSTRSLQHSKHHFKV